MYAEDRKSVEVMLSDEQPASRTDLDHMRELEQDEFRRRHDIGGLQQGVSSAQEGVSLLVRHRPPQLVSLVLMARLFATGLLLLSTACGGQAVEDEAKATGTSDEPDPSLDDSALELNKQACKDRLEYFLQLDEECLDVLQSYDECLARAPEYCAKEHAESMRCTLEKSEIYCMNGGILSHNPQVCREQSVAHQDCLCANNDPQCRR